MFVKTFVDKAKSVNVASSNVLAAAIWSAVKAAAVAAKAVGVALALLNARFNAAALVLTV
jgi:hypothetical protein